MNDAERVIAKFDRYAPLVILCGIVCGFLVAGGQLAALPIVVGVGVLLALTRRVFVNRRKPQARDDQHDGD